MCLAKSKSTFRSPKAANCYLEAQALVTAKASLSFVIWGSREVTIIDNLSVSGTTLIITQHDATIAIPIRDRVVANRDPRSDRGLPDRTPSPQVCLCSVLSYEHTTAFSTIWTYNWTTRELNELWRYQARRSSDQVDHASDRWWSASERWIRRTLVEEWNERHFWTSAERQRGREDRCIINKSVARGGCSAEIFDVLKC